MATLLSVLHLLFVLYLFSLNSWAQSLNISTSTTGGRENHTCTNEIELFRESESYKRIDKLRIHRGYLAFEVGGHSPVGTRHLSEVYSYDLNTHTGVQRVDDGSQVRLWDLDVHDGGVAYSAIDYGLQKEVVRVHPLGRANGDGQQTPFQSETMRARYVRGAHEFNSGERYFSFMSKGIPFSVPARLMICRLPELPRSQDWQCEPFSEEYTSGPIQWAMKAEPMLWNRPYPMFQLMQFMNTITGHNQLIIGGPTGIEHVRLGEPGQKYDLVDANEAFAVLYREEQRTFEGEEKTFNQLVIGVPDRQMHYFATLTPWEDKREIRFGSASISHGPSAFHSNDGRMKVAYLAVATSPRYHSELRMSYINFNLPQGVPPKTFKIADAGNLFAMDGDWIVYSKNDYSGSEVEEVLFARRCWYND